MFTEITFSEIKKYPSFYIPCEIVNIEKQTLNDSFIKDAYEYLNKFQPLQFIIMDLWWYYTHYHISMTTTLCKSYIKDKRGVQLLSQIFEKTILLINNKTKEYEHLQVEGLSSLGLKYAKNLIDTNDLFNLLRYDKPSKNDINRTCFFQFDTEGKFAGDYPLKRTIDDYIKSALPFENFLKFGYINVSALSLDEIEESKLLLLLSKHIKKIYLYNYDLEFNGEVIYVKYIHWYI